MAEEDCAGARTDENDAWLVAPLILVVLWTIYPRGASSININPPHCA